jgi:hypothetical protein
VVHNEEEINNPSIFERYAIGSLSIVVGLAIAAVSILGPLVLSIIRYRWSDYSILIVMGQDLIHLVLVVPICIIGGILRLIGNARSKYLLIAIGPYLIYQFLLLAIAPEWAHPDYSTQNPTSQNYFWLYIIIATGGLFIMLDSLSQFAQQKAPELSRKLVNAIFIYIIVFAVILATIWITQIAKVLAAGSAVKAYYRSPTVFWWIRIFDLSIVIPLALISVYAFVTRKTSGGYRLLLLGVGSLLLAFPVVAGSQLYTYLMLPGATSIVEIVFFLIMTLPIFPSYIYLARMLVQTPNKSLELSP